MIEACALMVASAAAAVAGIPCGAVMAGAAVLGVVVAASSPPCRY